MLGGVGRVSTLERVDYAELIWRKLSAEGVTQQKAADELGWQLSKLKMYAGLKSVCDEAWEIVGSISVKMSLLYKEHRVKIKTLTSHFYEITKAHHECRYALSELLLPYTAKPRWCLRKYQTSDTLKITKYQTRILCFQRPTIL